MTLGERIKKLRKELNLTQQEFSDRMGIKRNTIAIYETDRSIPSNAALSLICREFNVRETWLREGKGEMFADEDETLIAQIAAEYHLDENACALAKTFLSLSAERRAVIVQAVKILAEEYAAGASEPPQTAAEKQQTEMHELTAEEWANIQRERTAREFEKAAAGSLDSAG